MATAPDEFESERSRAAVAVACLQWLRCTGPATPPDSQPPHVTSPVVAELLRNASRSLDPIPELEPTHPHPLWDRWIDG
jgi:hypothetical protein